jgi:hypothetical protein
MKTLALFPLFLLLSSCSVYKSQGRKQFESESSGQVRTFSLLSCKKQNNISAWFQSEFPNYELVVAESDLEVWKSTNQDDTIDVRAVQINMSEQIICNYSFSNEGAWKTYQKQFIQELENNLMTAD